jgi:hypothetical protein
MSVATETKPLMVLKGVDGQLEVYPEKVRIRRRGLPAKLLYGFTRGEKDIYYRQIGSIQVKRAGLLNGFIKFAPTGGIEHKGGIMKQFESENSLVFSSKNNSLVDEIRQFIDAQIASQGDGAQ